MSDRPILKILLLPFLFALSGCWMSGGPLLDEENASPAPFVGRYSDPKMSVDPILVAEGEKGSYLISQKDEELLVHFLQISSEWFVLQSTDPATEEEEVDLGPDLKGTRKPTTASEYRLVRWTGENIEIIEPECTENNLAIEGVEGGDGTCVFASVDKLRKAAANYIEALNDGSVLADADVLRPWQDSKK